MLQETNTRRPIFPIIWASQGHLPWAEGWTTLDLCCSSPRYLRPSPLLPGKGFGPVNHDARQTGSRSYPGVQPFQSYTVGQDWGQKQEKRGEEKINNFKEHSNFPPNSHIEQQPPTVGASGTNSTGKKMSMGWEWGRRWFHALLGADDTSLACVAQFPTGCKLLLVRSPGVGELWYGAIVQKHLKDSVFPFLIQIAENSEHLPLKWLFSNLDIFLILSCRAGVGKKSGLHLSLPIGWRAARSLLFTFPENVMRQNLWSFFSLCFEWAIKEGMGPCGFRSSGFHLCWEVRMLNIGGNVGRL